ncbi:phospholipase DDHD1-like isoform X2 [Babylonia areolata]|uniref:phospholipase DDHD1-like isoform X2 n=1 Tax=Babylonia areolata TaxID=304850 RepID=UPI003FD37BF8
MEFPTFADMSLNSSSSETPPSSDKDRVFSSVDFFQSPPSDDDNYDIFDVDSSGTRSPAIESPTHKRYLYPQKEFVDELRPEELRWFYRSEGSKKWQPFIGYDSLRIECRYRALAIDEDGDIDVEERILVLGGLYEVDVVNKKCYPVYWSGDVSEIMRGVWFHETMQPLEECYTSQIEAEHMKNFLGQRLEEAPIPAKGPKPVIHNLKFRDFHVDWNASNEIYMFSESTSSKLMRRVTKSMGWQKSGTRIQRGYCYEAQMDDKPPDITHLVFVIHGIGQKMDSGAIVRCVKDLRDRVSSLQHKLFPQLSSNNQRAEFLPVEWRSSLKLDGDTVESITPNKMLGVRSILNSSAMDILYYTSPIYRNEILASLHTELIRLYEMFCARQPYFEANGGKVSVVSHSLGSVITYDIITGWNPIKLYDQFVNAVCKEQELHARQNQVPLSVSLSQQLNCAKQKVMELEVSLENLHDEEQGKPRLPFKLENLFCLGSPLAVFLALRGVRPQGTGSPDHFLPAGICRRIFNIYHPSDPVAYRLEPLVLKHYATIMPLPIHYFNATVQTPYTFMPRKAYAALSGTSADDQATKVKVENSLECSTENLALPQTSSDKTDNRSDGSAKSFSLSKWFSERKTKKDGEELSAELKMLRSMDREAKRRQSKVHYPEPQDIDKTELEYRLDYQLRERSMENSYLSLLTSHTAYWTNRDIALFILVHLFPQLQQQDSPV